MKRNHALSKQAATPFKRQKRSRLQPGSHGCHIMVESNPVEVPLGNTDAKRLCDSDRRGLKDRPPQYSALLKKNWLNTLKDDTPDSGCRPPSQERLPSQEVADVEESEHPFCSDQLTSENVGKISQCSRSSFSILTEDLEDSTATTSGCGIFRESRKRLLGIYSEICKHRSAGLRLNDKLKVALSEVFTQ
ncbi:hypothetical protein V500_05305 [Pseudogymnoascus sp. VKM F-4518 (FW-2643)]|nr:hypothetical protein V500_05305 [Pseudogymnoascus sp. VKM F-4518 (FW-2643)]